MVFRVLQRESWVWRYRIQEEGIEYELPAYIAKIDTSSKCPDIDTAHIKAVFEKSPVLKELTTHPLPRYTACSPKRWVYQIDLTENDTKPCPRPSPARENRSSITSGKLSLSHIYMYSSAPIRRTGKGKELRRFWTTWRPKEQTGPYCQEQTSTPVKEEKKNEGNHTDTGKLARAIAGLESCIRLAPSRCHLAWYVKKERASRKEYGKYLIRF